MNGKSKLSYTLNKILQLSNNQVKNKEPWSLCLHNLHTVSEFFYKYII